MDSMEINDDIYSENNFTLEGLIPRVDYQRRKQPSRCVTVSLGLLGAVLLAGNMGQFIYYEIISRPASTNSCNTHGDGLQSYDALTADRKQLEARLSNLTKEKDQFQQVYRAFTIEKDEFSNLKSKSDHLQTSYNTLKRESDRLQTSFHQLQSNYSWLKTDKDRLQRGYNTLNISKNHLQVRYNSLWKEKEQLQSSNNALQREKEQLQTNYSSLATLRDQLEKKILKAEGICETGWQRFNFSCYFVSALKKNWTLSRDDCIAKGADLVVIDSSDEQVFVSGLLGPSDNAWIGLTDSQNEGTWVWVDGTPVTTTYWQPLQPNSFNGNQDCGEMVRKPSGQVAEWNDDGCFSVQLWICETHNDLSQ